MALRPPNISMTDRQRHCERPCQRRLLCALRSSLRAFSRPLRAPSRPLRALAPLLWAVWASLVLCLAKPVVAATRSHTHRSAVTALPPASFVASSNSHIAKHRKAGTHAATPHSAKAATGTAGQRHGEATHSGKPGKNRRGRIHEPEPDDLVPMLRTGRHERSHIPRHDRFSAMNTPHGNDLPVRVHRGVHGNQDFAVAASLSGAHNHSSRDHPYAPTHRSSRETDDGMRTEIAARSAGKTSTAGETYAEGVAHPDDDERLPHQALSPAVAIGTAEVMAAPVIRPHSTSAPSQPQIVSGFGGELAVAPANTPDRAGDHTDSRPGGTRRRNHPIGASALAEAAPPVSLEERDAITEAAVSPAVLPELYDRNGRLVMPAPLKGSREVLLHQNTMANSDGLERLQDDTDLDRLRTARLLVNFPASQSLHINEDLPYNRRCARPWTVLFATDIGRDFFGRFHEPIYLTSAVRTVTYQTRLQRVNGNAAATDGDLASPHLTGQAIDLAKRGMSSAQLAWMRAYLLPLMQAGKIDVEEEFHQACFHISVYRQYAAPRRAAHELAQLSGSATRTAIPTSDATESPDIP